VSVLQAIVGADPANVGIESHALPRPDRHIGHQGRMMVDAALSPDGPHLLGDIFIGQTDGQFRAFVASTATPTLSILTSWAGNEAAFGDHPGGAVSIRVPTRG
jgi:hypothetical protein